MAEKDNGIKDRIKQIRATLGISQKDFASRVRISQSLLGEIEIGARVITERTIDLICEFYSVNKDFLLFGKGKPFRENLPDILKDKLVETYNQLNEYHKKLLVEQSKLLLKLQKEKEE